MTQRFSSLWYRITTSIVIVAMLLTPVSPAFAQSAIEKNSIDETDVSLDKDIVLEEKGIDETGLKETETKILVEEKTEEVLLEESVKQAEAVKTQQTISLQEDSFAKTDTVKTQHAASQPDDIVQKEFLTEGTAEISSQDETESKSLIEEILEPDPVIHSSHYSQLMRDVDALEKGTLKKERNDLAQELAQFIRSEKKRLDAYDIDKKNKAAYLELLRTQLRRVDIDKTQQSTFDALIEWLKELLGIEIEDISIKEGSYQTPELKEQIPEHPARFHVNREDIVVSALSDIEALSPSEQLWESIQDIILIPEVSAYEDEYMPVVADLRDDGAEVLITEEIEDLADSLGRNPVNIFNFVRNTINYEPYFGAKKGSVGCLHEQVCNDVDTTSLVIALMRASGIPARYKKTMAVMPVEQMQNLLGVEENNTIYAKFHLNQIPVHLLDDEGGQSDAFVGERLGDVDLSGFVDLAIEWTHPEIFYDYDERGGNIDNILDTRAVEHSAALRDMLRPYPKKQWIPVDAVVKPYERQVRPIVADAVNFDTEAFWFDYLGYQGDLSPMQKYRQDLLNQTGNDIANDVFQSYRTPVEQWVDILPFKTPYLRGAGVASDGTVYDIETWSVLPDARRYQVTISLKDQETDELYLSHQFFASEVNNVPVDLGYVGETEADKAIIEEQGSIAATPSALVDILPYFRSEGLFMEGERPLSIGQSMILQFDWRVNGELRSTDEKFSTAGNQEGIFITFSKIRPHPFYDDEEDPKRYQKILLEGNAMIGRELLKHIETETDLLSRALDYSANIEFARAVVTQSRVLTEVDNVPTTFDFRGLSVDAVSHITDQSNRGDFNNHAKDFRLLWGLLASDYEGQVFNDVAGLRGVATVQGLQYAFANPGQYDVHIISNERGNVNLLNQLNLSQNTIDNMRDDIEEGNTIVTPNQAIQKGEWRGILYVSLDPEWTGSYAIGEQVGNGGWTEDPIEIEFYCDHICRTIYQTNAGAEDAFIFSEREYDSVACSIQTELFIDITTNANMPADAAPWQRWSQTYGAPCYQETKQFGTVEHTFTIATNGTKFQGPGYDYWVHRQIARDTVAAHTPGYADANFKFNVIAGTYSHNKRNGATYYRPLNPELQENSWLDRGQGIRVDDNKIFRKLMFPHYNPPFFLCPVGDNECTDYARKKTWVLDIIGFPTGVQEDAAQSHPFKTDGYYQNFIGGQIYVETEWFNEAYYVPGYIAHEFNAPQYCQDGHGCGTGGELGFPVSDPVYNRDLNMIFQDFENGTRIKEFLSRPVLPPPFQSDRIEVAEDVQTIAMLRNYSDPEFRDDLLEGFVDGWGENNVFGVSINAAAGVGVSYLTKRYKDIIIEKLGLKVLARTTVRYVPLVGWIYAGTTSVLAVQENAPLYEACNTDPDAVVDIDDKVPAYYCGILGANASAFALGVAVDVGVERVFNGFGVNTAAAINGKSKIFVNADNDIKANNLNATVYGQDNRGFFFENIRNLDDDSLNNLLEDRTLMRELVDEAPFYKKTSITQVYDGNAANANYPDYNNPLPFPPDSVALEIEITNAIPRDEFVRFHGANNQVSAWVFRRKDIPYLNNGNIDTETIKEWFNIPRHHEFTSVSTLDLSTVDTLVQGKVNGGTNENIFQYGIKNYDALRNTVGYNFDPGLIQKL